MIWAKEYVFDVSEIISPIFHQQIQDGRQFKLYKWWITLWYNYFIYVYYVRMF